MNRIGNGILLALAASTLTSCRIMKDCIEGSGEVVSQSRDITGFRSIRVEGASDVILTQGPTTSVRIEAEENLMPLVTTTMKGDELTIGTEGCYSTDIGVKAYITLPELYALNIEGSGDVSATTPITSRDLTIGVDGSGDNRLNLTSENLTIRINGSGDMTLQGTATNSMIDIDGSGTVKAAELATSRSEVEIGGSGDCYLNVSDAMTVTINGSGDVRYKGRPTVKTVINGSGSVDSID